ncbi:sensor histidine kinase, partial [Labilibacter sediminis]
TSGTSNEAGTGFGINACRHFLEDNGGSFKMISEPGKGTSVIFALPQVELQQLN